MVLKDYLEANGVECELVARDPDRANLVARIPGTGEGPSLALLGHTDVVPADAEDWQHPPFAGDRRRRRLPVGPRRGRHEERDGDPRRGDGGARPRGLPAARRPAATSPRRTRRTAPSRRRHALAGRGAARPRPPTYAHQRGRRRAAAAGRRARRGADLRRREGHLPGRVVDRARRGRPRLHAHRRRQRRAAAGDADRPAGAATAPRAGCCPRHGRCWRRWLGEFGDDLDARDRAGVGAASRLPRPAAAAVRHHDRAHPAARVDRAQRDAGPGQRRVRLPDPARRRPRTTLEAELRAALGDDLPYELEFPEQPIGGTVAPIDTPLYRRLPGASWTARPRRRAAAHDLHRLHRLALPARSLRHRRLRLLAGRGTRRRRAATPASTTATSGSTWTTSATPSIHAPRLPGGGRAQ